MRIKFVVAALAALMFLACPFAAAGAADAGDPAPGAADGAPFTVTDGTGEVFEFAGPVDHIVTMGYASTLTVAEAGQISKIVAVDKYSTYENSKDERLRDLDAEDLGSIYGASNNDFVVAELVKRVEAGDMSLSDAVILTAYSNAKVLRTMLNDAGFTHVLVYLSVTDYSQIVDFVDDISMIVAGRSSVSDRMVQVRDGISDAVAGVEEKAKAMFVRYYKDSFTIGNTGSIAVSLIESAGGVNIGYNPDIDKSAYGDKNMVVQLLEGNRDAVVFVDAGYFKDGRTVDSFREEVLGGDKDIKVVPMEANWNNYCPDAADGLMEFAKALYPEIFGSFVVTDGTGEEFTFLSPVDHIVTMGYASTLTVAEAGQISKIVAVDKYSTYENSKDERLRDLDAENLGSIYGASNNDFVVTELVKLVEKGDLSFSDAVILTAYSNAKVLRTMLNDVGFTNVLVYLSVTDYSQIVDFVDDMSKIVGGGPSVSEKMVQMRDGISDAVAGVAEKPKAMFVRYYKGDFTIGNTGSIAVSLIESAGGVNIGYDPDVDKSAYGDKNMVVQLLEGNRDAVVFVDAGYFKDGRTVDSFREEVLGGDKDIKVVPMEANWNNYCPDAADGLAEFAAALYPEIFGPFVITDGTGEEFTFLAPVDHIVTMGYASTLTVAEAGQISKIVAVDLWSTYDKCKDERLKDLDAEDLGSIYYASNNDFVVAELVKHVEAGDLSLSDAVILTAYSNAKVLRTMLNDVGFTNVLVYLSVTDYSQIVDFVDDISMIVTGESKLTEEMEAVRGIVAEKLEGVAEKPKAMFVRSSNGDFTVGNTGSIAVSLIECAGGVNIGYDPDVEKSYHGDKNMIVQLLEGNRDAVVFVDNNYFRDGKTVSDFRAEVLKGDEDIKVVPMEANWNNYCPDAAEGLKVFACQLHPEIFGDGSIFGGDPVIDEGEAEESNTLLYVGAAAVVIVVVAVIGVFVMRRQ